MTDRAVVEQGINWVMSFVIGIVAIGFGVYMLFWSDNATTLIAAIIAFALLLGSLIHLLQGLRRHANEFAARAALLSGGVGVTVGAIVCLDLFYDYLTNPAARIILASGLIVYGVLGLTGMVVQRIEGTIVRTIVACAFALAFAALLIYDSQNDQLNTNWFAIALIVAGLLLLGIGYFARSQQSRLLQERKPSPQPVVGQTPPATRGHVDADASTPTGTVTRHDHPVDSGATAAPIIGQAPAGMRSDDIANPASSTPPPAGQPGQETRNRLLDRDGARTDGSGAGGRA